MGAFGKLWICMWVHLIRERIRDFSHFKGRQFSYYSCCCGYESLHFIPIYVSGAIDFILATTPGNSSFTCRHFHTKDKFLFQSTKNISHLRRYLQPVITISSIKLRAIRHASGLELPNSKYTSQKLPLWALPIFLENPRHFIHELSAFGRWR